MHYTNTEAALICDLITSYLFQPAVNASVKTTYSHALRRLQESRLTAADLTHIQNALSFVAPMCPDDREAHQDFMAVRLKTNALLRAATRLHSKQGKEKHGTAAFVFALSLLESLPIFPAAFESDKYLVFGQHRDAFHELADGGFVPFGKICRLYAKVKLLHRWSWRILRIASPLLGTAN